MTTVAFKQKTTLYLKYTYLHMYKKEMSDLPNFIIPEKENEGAINIFHFVLVGRNKIIHI